MSYKKEAYKYGLQYLDDLTNGIKTMDSITKDETNNIYKYLGASSSDLLYGDKRQFDKDYKENEEALVARTLLKRAADTLDKYVKANNRSDEAYAIADKTMTEIVADISAGGDKAKNRLNNMIGYDPEEGKMSTVVELADGEGIYEYQTDLDFGLSEKYGIGTQIAETFKGFTMIGGAVGLYQSTIGDEVEALGNGVKQSLSMRSTGMAGQIAGLAVGVGMSAVESAFAGALVAATVPTGGTSAIAGVAIGAEAAANVAKTAKTAKNLWGLWKSGKTVNTLDNVASIAARANSIANKKRIMNQFELGFGVLSGNVYDNVYSHEDTSFGQMFMEGLTMGTIFHGLNMASSTITNFATVNASLLNNAADPYITRVMKNDNVNLSGTDMHTVINNMLTGTKESANKANKYLADGMKEYISDMNSWTRNIMRSAGQNILSSFAEMGTVTALQNAAPNLYGDRFERMMNLFPTYMDDPNLSDEEKEALKFEQYKGIGMLVSQKMFSNVFGNVMNSRSRSYGNAAPLLGTNEWMEQHGYFKKSMDKVNHTVKNVIFGNTLANLDAAMRSNPVFTYTYNTMEDFLKSSSNRKYIMAAAIHSAEKANGWIASGISNIIMEIGLGKVVGMGKTGFNKDMKNFIELANLEKMVSGMQVSVFKLTDKKPSDIIEKKDQLGNSRKLTIAEAMAYDILGIDPLTGKTSLNDTDVADRFISFATKSDNSLVREVQLAMKDINTDTKLSDMVMDRTKVSDEERNTTAKRIEFASSVTDPAKLRANSSDKGKKFVKDVFKQYGLEEVREDSIDDMQLYKKIFETNKSVSNIDKGIEVNIVVETANELEARLRTANKSWDNIDASDVEFVIKTNKEKMAKKIDELTNTLVKMSNADDSIKSNNDFKTNTWLVVESIQNSIIPYGDSNDVQKAKTRFLDVINTKAKGIVTDAYKNFNASENVDAIREIANRIETGYFNNLNGKIAEFELSKDPSKISILRAMASIVAKHPNFDKWDLDTKGKKLLAMSMNSLVKGYISPEYVSKSIKVVNSKGEVFDRQPAMAMVNNVFGYGSDFVIRRAGAKKEEFVNAILTEQILKEALNADNVEKLLVKNASGQHNVVTINVANVDHKVKWNDDIDSIEIEIGKNKMSVQEAYKMGAKWAQAEPRKKFNEELDKEAKRRGLVDKTPLGLRSVAYFANGNAPKSFNAIDTDNTLTHVKKRIEKMLLGSAKDSLDSIIDIAKQVGIGKRAGLLQVDSPDVDASIRVLADMITRATNGRITFFDDSVPLLANGQKQLINEDTLLALLYDRNNSQKVANLNLMTDTGDLEVVITDGFATNKTADNVMVTLKIPDYIMENSKAYESAKDQCLKALEGTNLFYTGMPYGNSQSMMFLRIPANTTTDLKIWVKENIKKYTGSILGSHDELDAKVYDAITKRIDDLRDSDNELGRIGIKTTLASIHKDIIKILEKESKSFSEAEVELAKNALGAGATNDQAKALIKKMDVKFKSEDMLTDILTKIQADIESTTNTFDSESKKSALLLMYSLTDSGIASFGGGKDANTKAQNYLSKFNTDALIDAELARIDSVGMSSDFIKAFNSLSNVKNYSKAIEGLVERNLKDMESFNELKNRNDAMFVNEFDNFTGNQSDYLVFKKLKNNAKFLNEYLKTVSQMTGGDGQGKDLDELSMHFARGLQTGFNTLYGDHPGKRPITAMNNIFVEDKKLTNRGKLLAQRFSSASVNGMFRLNILTDASDREDGMMHLHENVVDGYRASMSFSTGAKLFLAMNGMVAKVNMNVYSGASKKLKMIKDGQVIDSDLNSNANILSMNVLKEFNHSHMEKLGVNGAATNSEADGYVIDIPKRLFDELATGKTIDEIKQTTAITKQQEIVLQMLFGLATHTDTKTSIGNGEFSTQPDNLGSKFESTILERMRVHSEPNVNSKLQQVDLGRSMKSLDTYKSTLHQMFNFRSSTMISAHHPGLYVWSNRGPHKFGFTEMTSVGIIGGETSIRDTVSFGSKHLAEMLESWSEETFSDNALKSEANKIYTALLRDDGTIPDADYEKYINRAMEMLSTSKYPDGPTIVQKHTEGKETVYTMISSRFPAQKTGQMGVSFVHGIVRGTDQMYVDPEYWGRVKNADFDGDTGNFNSVSASDVMLALRAFMEEESIPDAGMGLRALARTHEAHCLKHATVTKNTFASIESMPNMVKEFSGAVDAATGMVIATLDKIANLVKVSSAFQDREIKMSEANSVYVNQFLALQEKVGEKIANYKPGLAFNNVSSAKFSPSRFVAFTGEPNESINIAGSMNLSSASQINKDSGEFYMSFKTTEASTNGQKYIVCKVKKDNKSPMVEVIESVISDRDLPHGLKADDATAYANILIQGEKIKLFGKDEVKFTSILVLNDFIQSGPVDNVRGHGMDVLMAYFGGDDKALSKINNFIEEIALANKVGSRLSPDNKKLFSAVEKIGETVVNGVTEYNATTYDLPIKSFMENARTMYENGSKKTLSKDEASMFMKLNKNKSIEAEDLRAVYSMYKMRKSRYDEIMSQPESERSIPVRIKDAIYKMSVLHESAKHGSDPFMDMNFDKELLGEVMAGKLQMRYSLDLANGKKREVDVYNHGAKAMKIMEMLEYVNPFSLDEAIKGVDAMGKRPIVFDTNNLAHIAESIATGMMDNNRSYSGISSGDIELFLDNIGMKFKTNGELARDILLSSRVLGTAIKSDAITNTVGTLTKNGNTVTADEFFDAVKNYVNRMTVDPTKMLNSERTTSIIEGIVDNLHTDNAMLFTLRNSGYTKGLGKVISDQFAQGIAPDFSGVKISKKMLDKIATDEMSSVSINYKFGVKSDLVKMRKGKC